jgi:multiple sugar transport system permease protein
MPLWRRLLGLHLPVLIIVLFALGPYIWMFISSITPETDLYGEVFRYFPANPSFQNYPRIFQKISFARNLRDSLIVAATTMLVGLGISLTASYSFSRFRFRGRNYLMIQFLVINMFPIVLLLIPLFVIMRVLRLIDTYFALIIAYSTFTIPFSTWMMTSFFNAIPKQLDEAALVDGCTRLSAMTRVIVPIAMPGIAATGIYIFITAWNEFLYAAILTGNKVLTIPVALQNLIGEYNIAWGLLTAGGVISVIPVIVLFFFIQKQLISGMTAGAVKT